MLKNRLFVILFIFSVILSLLLIIPFFNKGLSLSVTPTDAKIYINDIEYKMPIKLKTNSKEVSILAHRKDYRKLETSVKIKQYGRTKVNISLEPLHKLEKVEYFDGNIGYWVTSKYDTFGQPTYNILYFDEKAKDKAVSLLKKIGVSGDNSIFEFEQDAD